MLNTLKSPKTTKRAIRVGRGIGSKRGSHTTGRGTKGQKSRSGYTTPRKVFEGGSMTLARRIPKLKGFSRSGLKVKKTIVILSLTDLNVFDNGSTVDLNALIENHLVTNKSHNPIIKILANGSVEKKLNLEGLSVSKKAKQLIEDKGGSIK